MKKVLLTLMSLVAMMAASTNLKAQEVTIVLMPGWTWISIPSTDTLDFETALGSFTPAVGDMIKSQWGNASYRADGHWRGQVSHFYPSYGYKYYSNRTMPVFLTFNAQQPEPQMVVTTLEPTDITATSAVVGGTVTLGEGNHLYARGVCWSTEPNPDINGSHTTDATVTGSLSATLTELTSNTTYYVRAYMVTDYGLAYGEEQSFTTESGIPMGAINGLFSVSENNQVYFSQGNLQYQASTNTWRFAENQWDYVGDNTLGTVYENGVKSDNALISSTYDGWIDLFCWGTGNDPTHVSPRPWEVFVDWGINPISNGGNCPNQWLTMSLKELRYLFVSRNTPSGIRFAKAVVNDINGIVLLPDDWQESYYTLNNSNSNNSSYASNIISLDDWASLESYGAVFFPAAGMRYGNIYNPGLRGQYWSCTDMYFDNRGHTMSFSDEGFSIGEGLAFYKDFGQSVRLVRFVQTPSFNINATPNHEEYGTVDGGGVYELGQTCTLTAVPNEGYTFVNWETDGVVVSTESTYSFVVRNNKNYVATFYDNSTYPLTYSYNETDHTATLTGRVDGVQLEGELVIPETVMHNGEAYTVTAIAGGVFEGCSGLISVVIPTTIISIEGNPFIRCSNLEEIIVEQGNAYYDSRNNCNAIIETATNKLVLGCQNTIIPNDVATIGGWSFFGCSHLTTIAIPNSVTKIEGVAFHSCGLVSVSLSENLIEIGQWAFHSCTNLTSISIPNGVTSLGAQAFIYCYSLISASLPSGITTIPHGLFQSCGNLASITIPSGVTFISSYAFLGCYSLASLTVLAETPPVLDNESLGDIFIDVDKTIPVYIPCGTLEAYQNAEGWSEFTNFIEMCDTVPTGAINGKFTINADGDQVYFSQGNLQYQASTNTWKFADNQYDYIGSANSNISSTNSDWIDLFGWGTSGYNHGANCYQPWSISLTYSDYYAYGAWTNNLNDQTGQADWGYNAISNGGNTTDQWRTLTQSEWNYVFNTRTTISGIRYAMANVNNVNGVILLPDDWSTSIYSLSNTNNFSSNTLTVSQWSTLEQAGAVFLPAAGFRNGISIFNVGGDFSYWSTSCSHSGNAYGLYFSGSGPVGTDNCDSRCTGRSVRLVAPFEN